MSAVSASHRPVLSLPSTRARVALGDLQQFPHLIDEARAIQAGQSFATPKATHLFAYEHLVQTLLAVIEELQALVWDDAGRTAGDDRETPTDRM